MNNKDSTPRANLIPPHGGYRELKSYQNAEIAYDGTVKFCASSTLLGLGADQAKAP